MLNLHAVDEPVANTITVDWMRLTKAFNYICFWLHRNYSGSIEIKHGYIKSQNIYVTWFALEKSWTKQGSIHSEPYALEKEAFEKAMLDVKTFAETAVIRLDKNHDVVKWLFEHQDIKTENVNNELQNRLINTIENNLGIQSSKINLNSSFVGDLQADSLDEVELVMAVEEAFNIEISEDEAEKIKTVQDALTLIETKLEGKN